MFWDGWEGEVLAAFGWKLKTMGVATPGALLSDKRIKAMTGWGKCESGAQGNKAAKNNPLGSTLVMPGSTKFNDANVQDYVYRWHGVCATAIVMCQQNMIAIRNELIQPIVDFQLLAVAISNSDWGTGYECLASVYGIQ